MPSIILFLDFASTLIQKKKQFSNPILQNLTLPFIKLRTEQGWRV